MYLKSNNSELQNIARTKYEKGRLVLTVQAFCEEKGLRSLFGVFGYAGFKNQSGKLTNHKKTTLINDFSPKPSSEHQCCMCSYHQ